MLATRSGQVGFFDAAELLGRCRRGRSSGCWPSMGIGSCATRTSRRVIRRGMGRPSIPPSQLAKVLLLQYRTGASDEQAMEAIAWDLRWKIALGLPVDHRGLASDVVDEVPGAAVAAWQGALALENTLGWPRSWGCWRGRSSRSSTRRRCSARPRRRTRSGSSATASASSRCGRPLDADAATSSMTGLEFDYARPGEKPDCRWRERAERERMLDSRRPGRRTRPAGRRAGRRAARRRGGHGDAHRSAARVDRPGLRHRRRRRPAPASRAHARTGSSRPSTRRCAMAARASSSALTATSSPRRSTNTPEPLIIAVDVAPACEQDGPQAKHLIDSQPERGARRGCWATPPTGPGRSAPNSPNATSTCSPRSPGTVKRRPAGQARLRDRPGRRHGHLPAGQTALIRTAAIGQAAARASPSACCDTCPLRDRCVAPARGTPPGRPHRARRRAPDRRPPSAR